MNNVNENTLWLMQDLHEAYAERYFMETGINLGDDEGDAGTVWNSFLEWFSLIPDEEIQYRGWWPQHLLKKLAGQLEFAEEIPNTSCLSAISQLKSVPEASLMSEDLLRRQYLVQKEILRK